MPVQRDPAIGAILVLIPIIDFNSLFMTVSHLVRRGSWICPRMRRAIAIVAISPRRISYITITLLLLNAKKSGCARDKVLRFRDQRMNVAHRKLIVRNWDRPRSVVGVGSCEICRVCSLRHRSASAVSHSMTYFTT